MPVTIKPAGHGANAYQMHTNFPEAANAKALFESTCKNEARKMKEINIFQSSFEKLSQDDIVFGAANGVLFLTHSSFNSI